MNDSARRIVDPSVPIIDSHHHLWLDETPDWGSYDINAFAEDVTASGHTIIGTVHVTARYNLGRVGPPHLRPVAETAFIEQQVSSAVNRYGSSAETLCLGIVAAADLGLGDQVGEVLDAHSSCSSRYRGVRLHAGFDPDIPDIYRAARPGLLSERSVRTGVGELARRNQTLDVTIMPAQLSELAELAAAFPECRIILDHMGHPLGVGRFQGRTEEAFACWRDQLAKIVPFENVSVKLGGLNASFTGLAPAATFKGAIAAELARLQRRHILTVIGLFGVDRCMFESNFPVERGASYSTLWEAFKSVTQDFSIDDKRALYSGTALRTYDLSIDQRHIQAEM